MINTKTMAIQNYGTSIMLFLKGENEQDAYEQWLDLLNFGAIGKRIKGGEGKEDVISELTNEDKPNYVADAVIGCWSTVAKLKRYLFMRHAFRLADVAKKGDKTVSIRAKTMADADYEAIAKESFRSVNNNTEPYEFGTITAEKPDDDFQDACWKHVTSSSEVMRNEQNTRIFQS